MRKIEEKGLFVEWSFYKHIYEPGMVLGSLHAHNYALKRFQPGVNLYTAGCFFVFKV